MIDSTEFDLLSLLIGCVIGVFIGWRLCSRFHMSMATDLLKAVGVGEDQLRRAIENLQAEVDPDSKQVLPGVEVRVECVDNHLYVYQLDTQEFLCQGATVDDIVNCLATRFHKDFKIIVSEEHGAKYLKPNPTN